MISFSTKAETLEALRRHLTSAQIKPLQIFTVAQWAESSEKVIQSIQRYFESKTVIIRSSVIGEDSKTASHAGEYRSEANIDTSDEEALRKACSLVIGSYHDENPKNQFFIQEQITSIQMCGVLLTRDLDTLAPYYVLNYDDTTGSHDSVTSGTGQVLKTWICFKESPYSPDDFRFRELIATARELETLFTHDALDIEFAYDSSDQLYILQVRPIAASTITPLPEASTATNLLARIASMFNQQNESRPHLCGKNAIFSVMTDWNPAEMIGIRPRDLSLSLYRELITDSTWAYQRHNYGYRNLRSFPLLFSFLGFPYIDVRSSFNSFIPASIDTKLANKLVDYFSEMLRKSPGDHDKVEFNIVFSCYYLNLPERLKKLRNFGFSDLELDRIKFALLTLTNNIISPQSGLFSQDLAKLDILEKRFFEVRDSKLPIIDKIYWLIEDCKRYGTLPFAGLARAGFIAVQFLRSFTELGIITKAEQLSFMNSLNTVTKQMGRDFFEFRKGELSRNELLKRYGHLRPGTYDILSKRYDEAFDTYFTESATPEAIEEHSFSFNPEQMDAIEERLVANGILISAPDLIHFIREAIAGRELGKFAFTRNVSEILKLVGELGRSYSLLLEDVSHLKISTLLEMYSKVSPFENKEILQSQIESSRSSYEKTYYLKLPQLITDERDIYEFFLGNIEPNFITAQRVTEVIVLEDQVFEQDLTNKIILIKSADPGYDWLFSRRIGGLVTMYGGANSHMAIRCAELKIPAVIGCGEENFKKWSASSMLDLDCANRQVTAVR